VQELMLKPKIKQTTLHTLMITQTKFIAERNTGIYKVEKLWDSKWPRVDIPAEEVRNEVHITNSRSQFSQ
jgi:hypothetical protein